MKLRVPKTERHKSADSKAKQIWRRVLLVAITVFVLGLAGTYLLGVIMANDDGTKNELLAAPENVVSRVVTPIQAGFSTVVNWFVDYMRTVKLRSRLELEYNNLKQENEQLVYQAMLAEELQKQLSEFQNLADEISLNEKLNPLLATVIGRESGNYFSVFTINKGTNDGVRELMAVTMDGALVGYTYDVRATQCSVRSIIDSEASIAALISSSRDQGTVRGTLGVDGQAMCRMYYLPEGLLPRPGDLVVTSGVSMSFPKGIPIGTVRESTRGMESNKQYIVVEPQADFQHIEYVIVLRYQPVAEEVESRADADTSIVITQLTTPQPVPTIRMGSDEYILAPTAVPTEELTPEPSIDPDGNLVTVAPSPTAAGQPSYEYQPPSGVRTNDEYGFTLAPTATPTLTPPPLDLSVEED